MVENNSTPERDLLKLIEEEGSSSGIDSGVTPLGTIRRGVSFLSLGGLRGRFEFLKDILAKGFKKEDINVKSINKILIIILAIVFVGVVVDIGSSSVGLKKQMEGAFSISSVSVISDFKEKSFLKDASYYLDKTKQRDIFNRVSKVRVKEIEIKGISQVKEIAEKTVNFKLVGISWSDNPDVMIEDTKIKKTFFLKRGDMIGNILVDEIYPEKVVLNYQGQTIELR